MYIAFEFARALSWVAFLFYGLACVFSRHMVPEFERYGLARLRVTVGLLEVAGAVGLLVGYWLPWLTAPAAGGLALLMLAGLVTRIRVRDPLVEMLPALVLGLVNAFVCAHAVGALG